MECWCPQGCWQPACTGAPAVAGTRLALPTPWPSRLGCMLTAHGALHARPPAPPPLPAPLPLPSQPAPLRRHGPAALAAAEPGPPAAPDGLASFSTANPIQHAPPTTPGHVVPLPPLSSQPQTKEVPTCVIPPASPDATRALRIKSRSDVLPAARGRAHQHWQRQHAGSGVHACALPSKRGPAASSLELCTAPPKPRDTRPQVWGGLNAGGLAHLRQAPSPRTPTTRVPQLSGFQAVPNL